jgi:hypothetical protein
VSVYEELEYEPHFERHRLLFGDDDEAVARAHQKAQYDHSLVIYDAFRNLAVWTTNLSYYVIHDQARYYLRYGAGRRLLMMWYAYRHITSTAYPERTEPLSEDDSQEMGKNVNLIYMHLRGALDNLAWCLLYEKFPGRSDMNPMQVGLFTNPMQSLLGEVCIYDEVQKHADWNREVKNRRDPVAHRIPLTVPPALLSPDETKEAQALHSKWEALLLKMAQHAYERRHDEVQNVRTEMDHLERHMNRLGSFFPYFVHHPDQPIIPIYPTLPTDLAHVIKLTKIVGTALAPEAPSISRL